ncbi:MAG: hypothetical protein C4527_26320 [Candidatus Omnitrophota bacterium]|nr:MAG: hypothetical protein C4527_26320 [Candidatus Omnitrophota bacterium]
MQVPAENVAWDMHLSSEHGSEMEKHLLWVATRKEYVDSLLEEWPENTLNPTQITPDFWALYEFVLGIHKEIFENPCIMVSLEGDRANLTLATQKSIYLTRSVALDRPHTAGTDTSDSSLARERILSLEIERTLSYVADRFPRGSIRNMLLCGFENWDLSLIQTIADRNDLAVQTIGLNDATTLFTINPDVSLLPEHFPILCMAYCRLERHLNGPNLLGEEEEAAGWQHLVPDAALPSKKFMTMAGGLVGFTVLLWIAGTLWYGHARAVRLEEGKELIKIAEKLRREEAGLREMSRTDVNYAELFVYLSSTLPNEIIVKSINLDIKTGVDMVLVGGNYRLTQEIVEKLNSGNFLRDVVEDRAVNEKEGFTVYLKGKLKFGA